ncbi:MAG: relaxase/mobilization nuclease and DUF3363 domain-containing protein [Emcibacter sp.]|nr:relaxase/mobilization nuclease and DUF3363 domain-containing protein [Emcibacter sp.]
MARKSNEDDFRVRMGKPRTQTSRMGRNFLDRMRSSIRSGKKLKIGRGKTASYSLKIKQRSDSRRVIIKTRLIKLVGSGVQKAKMHMDYIQRDGVTREGEAGLMYDVTGDNIEAEKFNDLCNGDRHQFRLIVSPEDAHELRDLKSYVRGIMDEFSEDLGTNLEWVAVDHYNTVYPHSHIIIRGKDELGKDLIISRDYLSYGMRKRAEEMLTLELGPKSEYEITKAIKQEITKDRLTSLDRKLLTLSEEGQITVENLKQEQGDAPFLAQRLNHLQKLKLAEKISSQKWLLSDDMPSRLKQMGERGDIIKRLHRSMKNKNPYNLRIYDVTNSENNRLVGQVIDKGLSDELNDRYYITIDGIEGQLWYVDVGNSKDIQDVPVHGIVSITSSSPGIKPADKLIAEISAQNGGYYSPDIHNRFNPKDSPEFIQAHIRRLEALRMQNMVQRSPDGRFKIPGDFLQSTQKQVQSVNIETLSNLPLNQLATYDGVTWLDQILVGKQQTPNMSGGFGKKLSVSLQQRQQYLVQNELAEFKGDQFVPHKKMLAQLRQIELLQKARAMQDKLALKYRPVTDHQRQVTGTYKHSIILASGKYAVLTKAKEFTLVPWRPVMEQARGKMISGIIRGNSISWQFGRSKGVGR